MKPKEIQDAIDNGAWFMNDADEARYHRWSRSQTFTLQVMIVLIVAVYFLAGLILGQGMVP